MNKSFYFAVLITMALMVSSTDSWGSETLPQLWFSDLQVKQQVCLDTIPAKTTSDLKHQPDQNTAETVAQPVVKQVPKSRKKIKPATVTPKVKVPPTKIIKPKIVIKKINVNIP